MMRVQIYNGQSGSVAAALSCAVACYKRDDGYACGGFRGGGRGGGRGGREG